MTKQFIQKVIDAHIHSIILSDHAPVSVSFFPSPSMCKTKKRRLNNSLLKNVDFADLTEKKKTEFFDINLKSVSLVSTVWEAFKATCRGWVISYASAEKKKPMKRKIKLCNELKALEEQHMSNLSNLELRKSIFMVKADLQSLLHEETANALFQLCKIHFESSDKAGKMFAHKLKQVENLHFIPAISDSEGTPHTDNTSINLAFKQFFSNLYTSEYKAKDQDLNEFFNGLDLSALSVSENADMESPITQSEIEQAIGKLASNKTPGEDGFTLKFYKHYCKVLSPILLMLFNEAIETKLMPPSMRQAIITVFPKPGKDHKKMENYRPLSILNNDYKILAKILALRLERVIPSLIHIVGYISELVSANNMHRLLHVITSQLLQSPRPWTQ